MNVNIKINQSDLNKLKNKLDKMRAFESKTLSNELGKTGLEIVRLAKREVRYDNGDLRKSISAETNKTTKSVVIQALAHYAPYVEFGTGGSVDLTDMIELGIPPSYAAQFKGKGIREVNLPARPFFFSSARVGFNNMLKRVDKKLKKLL